MPGNLTSALGFMALLDEEDEALRVYALKKLNDVVDLFWAELADEESIGKIEKLYEDKTFSERKLAALVASKVYFHLDELQRATEFALGAEELFDLTQDSEFVNTMINKFIDEYIRLRARQASDSSVTIDKRHEDVVLRMFERCFQAKKYRQAIGIGLESRRLDQITVAIKESGDVAGMLDYCFDVSQTLVKAIDFRFAVFRLLVDLYMKQEHPNYLNVSRIYVFLDDVDATASLLQQLMSGAEGDLLMAFQIGFDLCNNASQQFRACVRSKLPTALGSSNKAETSGSGDKDAMDVADEKSSLVAGAAADKVDDSAFQAHNAKLHSILSGEISIGLHLDFLNRRNKSDLLVLRNIKNALNERNSVTHSALIYANALMHCGTTSDTFLRENLEWLSRATNWAKFSATAGLGTIHKGHLKEGLSVLRPYLPPDSGVGPSPYSEGGALFALGIIHSNHGDEITSYLRGALRNGVASEIIQHGGCLGLGVAGMASGSMEIYEDLRNVLMMDQAVPGEGAGLGMGLVMMGTANADVLEVMLEYAHQTKHEKTIRGLAIGMALLMYRQEENADTIIEQLTRHESDPILRYGGVFTIGMAYCGTANNDAIQRLLHVAVSDVNDDVRRGAVINIGFLLSREPKQCPRMVQLLAASYNPHVRYGATMAVGIACAGTALKEAVELLIPMASDPVHFVSQGALIALAMVLIQTTAAQEPKVDDVRKLFVEKVTDRHQPVMAKFGAILAQGIIDAGGRNVTIAPHSLSGHTNMSAMAGLAVFTQHWYWYPLVHFITLSFTPTAIIGLTKDLQMPKFQFRSNAKPSLFAYPEALKAEVKEKPTKVKTAVLSTTKKALLKQSKLDVSKSADDSTDQMDVEGDGDKNDEEEKEKEKEQEEKEKEEKEKEKEPEPDFEILANPARVVPKQLKHLSFSIDERYQVLAGGESDIYDIVMLRDTLPDAPVELVTADGASTSEAASTSADTTEKESSGTAAADDDLEPPPAFEFDG